VYVLFDVMPYGLVNNVLFVSSGYPKSREISSWRHQASVKLFTYSRDVIRRHIPEPSIFTTAAGIMSDLARYQSLAWAEVR
jgi:hypothetical protein